jgi:hypothetical protein
MNTLFYVVCIVAIVSIAGVVTEFLKARASKEKSGADVNESQVQIAELEERVRVLERIVTESKFDLRKEIDKL